MVDQEYFIADNTKNYVIPSIIDPLEDCGFTYTYTISDPMGDLVATFDSANPEFAFYYDESLTPLTMLDGKVDDSVDYTITVTATDVDGLYPTSGTFVLTVLNPCIDPDHTRVITPLSMPTYLKYRLTDLED